MEVTTFLSGNTGETKYSRVGIYGLQKTDADWKIPQSRI
jgi:hypothetical protein